MTKMFVEIQLEVEVNGSEMLAHLVFFNNTGETLYLDTKTICTNGQTRRNIFNITDESNGKIKYAGIMEKRFVAPEDFIPIDPGDKIETNIILNEVYRVNKGQKYFIQYSVYHPSYNDEQGINKMESNIVEVVY
jgi:hypothetical protein